MTRSGDFSLRLTPSFVDGVLVSAGAIADATVIYCGSTCIDERAFATVMRHDLAQTLVATGGATRLVTTFTDYSVAPMGTARVVEETALKVLRTRRPGVLVLAELSRVTIAGEDLRGTCEALRATLPVPIVAATSRTLVRDASDALAGVLEGLARALPDAAFDGGLVPDRVALIGYDLERAEGDHVGNLECLGTALAAVGLYLAPPWLSGATFARLQEAARASLILALPEGRQAASVLAARSGARVLEVGLPVGLASTSAWLRGVATACGRPDAAEPFIEAQLARIVPRLDWVTERLAGRRVGLCLAPGWLDAVEPMLTRELGIDVAFALARARLPPEDAAAPPGRSYDPTVADVRDRIRRARDEGGLDLLVASSWEATAAGGLLDGVGLVEFGYPSFDRHFLRPTP
ncbi:MAG TPA: nitrogenase component 1, partial [Anaeromyxobacter sp.]